MTLIEEGAMEDEDSYYGEINFGDHVIDHDQSPQYVMPECYGRGRRFQDILLPVAPRSYLGHVHEEKASNVELFPPSHRKGRGRANTLKRRTEQMDMMLNRPGGLSDHHQNVTAATGKPTQDASDKSSHSGSLLLDWTLQPPNVVQLEGLSNTTDMELLHDIVAHYGTILETEMKEIGEEVFIRFKEIYQVLFFEVLTLTFQFVAQYINSLFSSQRLCPDSFSTCLQREKSR